MSTSISVRLDDRHLSAVDALAAEEGVGRSDAIRIALEEAHAARRRRRLREESAALASDPEDVAEIRRVAEDMESLVVW